MIFWGDIHNHNAVGYGLGSPERAVAIGKQSLDFLAFTPHGWWPDLPNPDSDVAKRHLAGFDRTKAAWKDVQDLWEKENRAGHFVTLPAYEWHSLQWGDFCLYFQENRPPLFYAQDLHELREFATANEALMIPHHCGYPVGRRGTNWKELGLEDSPVCEVFSEHGSSFNVPSSFPMLGHSMGGAQKSQTILWQLELGRKVGFTAGTDNHFGHPGSYGQGLTGIYTDELSRESVFRALLERHTFAVTGDRIEAQFGLGSGQPGDEISTAGGTKGFLSVHGREAIETIDILKNGRTWKRFLPNGSVFEGTESPRIIRLEWGWDGLGSQYVTKWEIDAKLGDGEIIDVEPGFSSGPTTVDFVPEVLRPDREHLRLVSWSTRANDRPTQQVVLRANAESNSILHLEVICVREGKRIMKRLNIPLKFLEKDDFHVEMADEFTFPRLKIHAIPETTQVNAEFDWEDTAAVPGDFYILQIRQQNGQMAWTSPIWCI